MFRCRLYINKREPQFQWMEHVLYSLWQRGVVLQDGRIMAPTWDEQLKTIIDPSRGSLQDAVDRIIQDEYGFIHLYDRAFSFAIRFDSLAKDAAFNSGVAAQDIPYGIISLTVLSPVLEDERLKEDLHLRPTAYLIPPRYQGLQALIHWSKVLCELLDPVFGVGYLLPEAIEGIADEDTFAKESDITFMRAIAANQLPPLHDWLKKAQIQYVPASLITTSLMITWASQPDQNIQILATGGLFSFNYLDPYEIIIANEYEQRGRSLNVNQEHLNYLVRAREIYALHTASYPLMLAYIDDTLQRYRAMFEQKPNS